MGLSSTEPFETRDRDLIGVVVLDRSAVAGTTAQVVEGVDAGTRRRRDARRDRRLRGTRHAARSAVHGLDISVFPLYGCCECTRRRPATSRSCHSYARRTSTQKDISPATADRVSENHIAGRRLVVSPLVTVRQQASRCSGCKCPSRNGATAACKRRGDGRRCGGIVQPIVGRVRRRLKEGVSSSAHAKLADLRTCSRDRCDSDETAPSRHGDCVHASGDQTDGAVMRSMKALSGVGTRRRPE